LQDIFAFEVGVVREKIVNRTPRADLADDRSDGDAQTANAGFPAHHLWILSDPIRRFHGCLPSRQV
jgi:hypothetical protein